MCKGTRKKTPQQCAEPYLFNYSCKEKLFSFDKVACPRKLACLDNLSLVRKSMLPLMVSPWFVMMNPGLGFTCARICKDIIVPSSKI